MAIEESIMFVAIILLIGWALWLFFKRQQLSHQLKAQRLDAFNRLLEKFATAKEFIDFAQTDQGRKFIEDPVPAPTSAINRTFRFLASGLLFIGVGIALIISSARARYLGSVQNDITYTRQSLNAFAWGSVALYLGFALALVALISYLLMRRWNLDRKA